MKIILGADDFGSSAAANTAIQTAHRRGLLTSTSLVIAGAAAAEAVSLAREMPDLAVGLHLALVGGPAVLPPECIPHLVDGDGQFPGDPLQVGLRYAFDRQTRRELAAEMRAQFEGFAATGLPLSHVDGHKHMHLHPVVFDLLLPLAEEYGARGLRLPRDNLCLALAHSRRGAGRKVLWALAFALLNVWYAHRLRGHNLVIADRVYGLMQIGEMHEAYVLDLIRHLQVPVAEIYFHPTAAGRGAFLGQNEGDLRTLLSPAVRQAIEQRGITLTTYPALKAPDRSNSSRRRTPW